MGKCEGQIIFLGVNIYPYHPNSALMAQNIGRFWNLLRSTASIARRLILVSLLHIDQTGHIFFNFLTQAMASISDTRMIHGVLCCRIRATLNLNRVVHFVSQVNYFCSGWATSIDAVQLASMFCPLGFCRSEQIHPRVLFFSGSRVFAVNLNSWVMDETESEASSLLGRAFNMCASEFLIAWQ
jgi:hypothetical protein